MSNYACRHATCGWRWRLIGAVVVLAIAAVQVLIDPFGIFGPHPRHLRERWEAGEFDLSEDERSRLREIAVEFNSSYAKYADDPIEQTKLAGSRVIRTDSPVTRREPLAAFRRDPSRKVAVTSERFRQFYQAYTNQDHPVFITSDSILNAFHRILEDSIVKLEFRQVEKLRRLLPELQERLSAAAQDSDSDVTRSARRRAQITLGVARRLIDPDYEPDPEIREIVRAESQRVESGSGRSMPGWLGEPSPSFLAIDYSQFQPEGIHTRSALLRRHYRSVRWLQTIPFHLTDDEHLMAIGMIAEAAKDTNLDAFVATYRGFFGETDDWDVQTLRSLAEGSRGILGSIEGMRDKLRERLDAEPPSRINDLVATEFSPSDPEALSLRVLSAFRTPEAVLLQSAAESIKPDHSIGLLLCTALGSTLAREHLVESNGSDVLGKPDRFGSLSDDDSVYGEYLQCLATLLEPIDAAPEFMSTRHWQLKSCQTVLGGWTQMRHTFALQAKQNALILSESSHVGSGFVEPNPEFFRRLGRLAARIEGRLDKSGVFEINFGHLRFRLNEFARCFKLVRVLEQEGVKVNEVDEQLTSEDLEFFDSALDQMGSSAPFWWLGIDRLDGTTSELILAAIVQLSDPINRGELPNDPAARGALLEGESSSNRVRWLRLVEVCERLRVLADKQLDGQAFTDWDQQYITDYGEELAGLLNYEAYSGANPLDDAMRCVSVLTRADGNHLHVAVSRPQAIYLLYPHQGEELLCRGAVFPYFEFSDEQIVDDAAWKSRLDRWIPPKRPDWLEPLYTDD